MHLHCCQLHYVVEFGLKMAKSVLYLSLGHAGDTMVRAGAIKDTTNNKQAAIIGAQLGYASTEKNT